MYKGCTSVCFVTEHIKGTQLLGVQGQEVIARGRAAGMRCCGVCGASLGLEGGRASHAPITQLGTSLHYAFTYAVAGKAADEPVGLGRPSSLATTCRF